MSRDTEEAWVETLDLFEASLDHHATVLQLAGDERTSAAVSPWPPAELPTGPIPLSQVARARALNARCDELSDGVVAALAEAINPPRRTGGAGRRSVAHQGYRSTPEHARISIDL